MNEFIRRFIIIFIVIYVFCPLDLHPGPVDDILISVLGILVHSKLGELANPADPADPADPVDPD